MSQVKNAEWLILDRSFSFHCAPYFLRSARASPSPSDPRSLTLPGAVAEDGRERAVYNLDRGELKFTLPKAVRGEFFVDLDMVSLLLRPSPGPRHPLIEVLHTHAPHPTPTLFDEAYDWSYPSAPPPERDPLLGVRRYGFNRSHVHFFEGGHEEACGPPTPFTFLTPLAWWS